MVREAARRSGLPPEFVESVALVESGMRSDAISPKGAIGVMQLMPGTAKIMGADPHDTVHIRELLTSIDSRLTLLEERQDFAEALISAGDTKLLSVQAAQHAQERN